MLGKAGDEISSNDSPFGELTQRLVAGLMEENVIAPIEENLELGAKKGSVGPFWGSISTTRRKA